MHQIVSSALEILQPILQQDRIFHVEMFVQGWEPDLHQQRSAALSVREEIKILLYRSLWENFDQRCPAP